MKSIVLALLAVVACGKSDTKEAPPATGQPTPSTAAERATPPSASPSESPSSSDVEACSLLTAADITAVFGKTVIAKGQRHECEYALDPAEQQKAVEEMVKAGAAAARTAGGGYKVPSGVSAQLVVNVQVARATQSEEQLKAMYSKMVQAVDSAVKPVVAGAAEDSNALGQDIPSVGEWAFSRNIISTDVGGVSSRGRLLEAKQGTWRLTLTTNISPDPGATKLDTQMATLAAKICAKLK